MNSQKVLYVVAGMLSIMLILYLLRLTEIFLLLVIIVLAAIAYIYSEKERIPHTDKHHMPSELIRVTFTSSARKKRGGGNLAKQVILIDGYKSRSFPYHPTFVALLASFTHYPIFDETFGQEEPPMPIVGEVNIPVGVIIED